MSAMTTHLLFVVRQRFCTKYSRFAFLGTVHFSTNEDLEYLKNLRSKPVDKSGDHPFGNKKPTHSMPTLAKNKETGVSFQKSNPTTNLANVFPERKPFGINRRDRANSDELNHDIMKENETFGSQKSDQTAANLGQIKENETFSPQSFSPEINRENFYPRSKSFENELNRSDKLQANEELAKSNTFDHQNEEKRTEKLPRPDMNRANISTLPGNSKLVQNSSNLREKLEANEIISDDELEPTNDLFEDGESITTHRFPVKQTTDYHDSSSSPIPTNRKSYSLSPLINKSKTLRNLVDLGVDLSQIEVKYDAADFLLHLNWETDVLPRLYLLLTHACVDKDSLGSYVTKNPWIFQQDVDDLQTRVNYLESKGFSKAAIARIVTNAPYWLNINVQRIDSRLIWYKDEFRLTNDELRFITTKNPNLITMGTGVTQLLQFSFEEEMGFDKKEIKTLLLKDPKLFSSYKDVIVKTFDYLHNKMGISHKHLLSYPRCLRVYKIHIQERHEFLQKRKLNQYDPEKPNFVPLYALVGGTDEDFCRNVAKCSVKEFNTFLKSR